MKLKSEFIVHATNLETILVPTGQAEFSGIVKGNSTFGAILEILGQERTFDELVDALCDRFDGPRELIEADAKRAVDELTRVGALDA